MAKSNITPDATVAHSTPCSNKRLWYNTSNYIDNHYGWFCQQNKCYIFINMLLFLKWNQKNWWWGQKIHTPAHSSTHLSLNSSRAVGKVQTGKILYGTGTMGTPGNCTLFTLCSTFPICPSSKESSTPTVLFSLEGVQGFQCYLKKWKNNANCFKTQTAKWPAYHNGYSLRHTNCICNGLHCTTRQLHWSTSYWRHY